MSTAEIVAHLTVLGVKLSIEGGELQCRAPRAVATPELRDLIAANKQAILWHLEAEADFPDDPAPSAEIGPNTRGKYTPHPGCMHWRYACPVLGPCDWHRAGLECPQGADGRFDREAA